jgi:large subunit ribosomal protein L4
MCLSDKVNDNNLIVVDALDLADAKTQSLKKIIDKLPGVKKNKMVILAAQNQNFVKASLNLKNTKIILADSLNVYDVLNNQTLIIDQAGINKIIATYKK